MARRNHYQIMTEYIGAALLKQPPNGGCFFIYLKTNLNDQ